MINKINLNKVASYKNVATLETNKKVNLIYGLNGVGKSTSVVGRGTHFVAHA